MVDEKRIAFNPSVELSYLPDEAQKEAVGNHGNAAKYADAFAGTANETTQCTRQVKRGHHASIPVGRQAKPEGESKYQT